MFLCIIIFNFHDIVLFLFIVSYSLVLLPYFPNQLLSFFLALNSWIIYCCWNQTGCNILICRSWFLLFQLQLGMWFFFCTLMFYVIKWLAKESGGFVYLFIFVQYQGRKMEDVLCRVLVYQNESYFDSPLFTYNYHFWKEILCCYIMKVLLIFVIRIWLIIWSLLWYKIIIGGTWCFTIIKIMFWINFTRAVLLMHYNC